MGDRPPCSRPEQGQLWFNAQGKGLFICDGLSWRTLLQSESGRTQEVPLTPQTCQGHVTKTHYIRRVILLCVRRCSFYCINLYITNVVLNIHDAKSVCKKLEMMILNGSGF